MNFASGEADSYQKGYLFTLIEHRATTLYARMN